MIARALGWLQARSVRPGASPKTAPRSERATTQRIYRPHPPAYLYAVVTVFLAIGAVNSQNNLLFVAFGLAVAGLVVSGFISGAMLMNVSVHRTPPADTHAGEPTTIRYRVTNASRWLPAFALSVEELDPESPQGRWRTLWRPMPGLGAAPGALLHLAPGETAAVETRCTPSRRGRYPLGTVALESSFPFGLLRKAIIQPQPGELLVGPARINARSDLISASSPAGGEVRRAAARAGLGQEFFGLRDYVPGDSTRLIAWRPSARSQGLVVRQLAAPEPPRVWIRIEDEADPLLTERALALAAAVTEHALRASLAVGVIGPDGRERARLASGAVAWSRILRALAAWEDDAKADRAPIARLAARDGLIRIASNPDPAGPSPAHAALTLNPAEPGSWLADASLPDLLLAPDPRGDAAPRGGPRSAPLRRLVDLLRPGAAKPNADRDHPPGASRAWEPTP